MRPVRSKDSHSEIKQKKSPKKPTQKVAPAKVDEIIPADHPFNKPQFEDEQSEEMMMKEIEDSLKKDMQDNNDMEDDF